MASLPTSESLSTYQKESVCVNTTLPIQIQIPQMQNPTSTPWTTKTHDKNSLQYILHSGIAGGIAGCVSKTLVAPLERIKILFQTGNPDFRKHAGRWSGVFRAGRMIYDTAGVRGLLQGHSATLLRIFPYAGIKFMTYDQVHNILMPTRERETNVRRFVAGAISGTASVFCTYPLEVIRVRMAFDTTNTKAYSGNSNALDMRPSFKFLRAAKHIYDEGRAPTTVSVDPSILTLESGRASAPAPSRTLLERIPALRFYRGFTVTVLGMIPYAGMTFLAWGFLRECFLPSPSPSSAAANSKNGSGDVDHAASSTKSPSTPVADLAIGALSGGIAQTVSYPFEVTRRRMQVGGLTRPDGWLGVRETVEAIWRTSGWRGFYVGLSIGYLKIVPMTAVCFAVWRSGKGVLGI